MMKYLIFLLFAMPLCAFEQYEIQAPNALLELSENIAISQVGIEESGKNCGDVVKYLQSVGLSGGYPYCAAGQYWSIKTAADSLGIVKSPFPRTGLARIVYNYFKQNGNKCKINPKRHSFIIWQKGKSQFGHIERIIAAGKAGNVTTIAFNVRFTKSGRSYEGVSIKRRSIYHILNRMHVLGIASYSGYCVKTKISGLKNPPQTPPTEGKCPLERAVAERLGVLNCLSTNFQQGDKYDI